tara:strand:+ start:268 stop:585 length:318 start_codon:yes stop_codon:yes gene_type:complete
VDLTITFVELAAGSSDMAKTKMHKEDVKAELRKRFGSLDRAQEALGLKGQQLRDLLRGKSSAAHEAVARELAIEPDSLEITGGLVRQCGAKRQSPLQSERQGATA